MESSLTPPLVVYVRTEQFATSELIQKSIEIQIEACISYIFDKNSQCPYKIYVDMSSGDTLDRERLKELFNEIKRHRVKTVVLYKLDVLATSLETFSKILKFFARHGVGVIPVFNLDNKFLMEGNPQYKIETKSETEENSQLLNLAKKYLYIPNTDLQEPLLNDIVRCKNCGNTMVETEINREILCLRRFLRCFNNRRQM